MNIANFNDFLNKFPECINICKEINKYNAITLAPDKNNEYLDYHIIALPQMSRMTIDLLGVLKDKKSSLLEMYVLSQAIKNGIKIFRPTNAQCEALEKMELNISIEDYVQPFDTMIIEPPDYYRNQGVVFYIIKFEKALDTIITMIMFKTTESIKNNFIFKHERILENYLKLTYSQFDDSLPITKEEEELNNRALKTMINYCLLLDEVGIKRVGPVNPKHYNKCIERNQSTKTIPIVYDLNREVQLVKYHASHDHSPYNHDPNRHVSPHHRRGFYKMQPHGPKNELRKRIRIPAVMVNADLLINDQDLNKIYKGID